MGMHPPGKAPGRTPAPTAWVHGLIRSENRIRSQSVRAIRRFTIHPVLPEGLDPLRALMLNLRWSWHAGTRALFASIDPAHRELAEQDPVALLANVAQDRLTALASDSEFLGRLAAASDDLREYLTGERWYQDQAGNQQGGEEAHAGSAGLPRAIAYFSPEYGITEVLPQYSGGLGILAADHLKAASDLGVPLIGVGLLYRHGYFTQSLSIEGWQAERYPPLDPQGLPLKALQRPDGSPVRVALSLPDNRTLQAQVWVAQVGRVPLLLLDSDIEENDAAARQVTDRLYGGN